MLQNVILIILIIIIIFFLSNEQKVNDLFSKKYIKWLFFLLIVYFIYQNYNITILVGGLLILLFFNTNLKEKFKNNKIIEIFKEYVIEKFSNDDLSYDFKPYVKEETKEDTDNSVKKESKNKTEPFKNDVNNLKELYENIKLEIKKLT